MVRNLQNQKSTLRRTKHLTCVNVEEQPAVIALYLCAGILKYIEVSLIVKWKIDCTVIFPMPYHNSLPPAC